MLSYLSAIIAAFSFALLCVRLQRFPDLLTRFLLVSLWLRYAMAAFPDVTYRSLAAGLSMNALGTLLVIGVGLIVIRPNDLLLKRVITVYPLVLLVILSGGLNHQVSGAINNSLKWGYYIVISIAAFRALQRHGAKRLLATLSVVFLLPLSSQYASILLGQGKVSEFDNSVVFIGSYQHEAVFSTIVLTFLFVSCFAGGVIRQFRPLFVGLAICSLAFANYRTTMLASLPLIAAIFAFGLTRRFTGSQKALVASVAAVGLIFAAFVVGSLFAERFNDLLIVLSRGTSLIKPPDMFDDADQDLFSGRIHIWSGYIFAYLQGSDLQLLLGFGPDSWTKTFNYYAHNTFVSYLYESGVVGLLCLLIHFIYQLWQVREARAQGEALFILAAHGSFLILNLATMPLWQIEGVALYALICAYTWYRAAEWRQMVRSSRVGGVWRPAGTEGRLAHA